MVTLDLCLQWSMLYLSAHTFFGHLPHCIFIIFFVWCLLTQLTYEWSVHKALFSLSIELSAMAGTVKKCSNYDISKPFTGDDVCWTMERLFCSTACFDLGVQRSKTSTNVFSEATYCIWSETFCLIRRYEHQTNIHLKIRYAHFSTVWNSTWLSNNLLLIILFAIWMLIVVPALLGKSKQECCSCYTPKYRPRI